MRRRTTDDAPLEPADAGAPGPSAGPPIDLPLSSEPPAPAAVALEAVPAAVTAPPAAARATLPMTRPSAAVATRDGEALRKTLDEAFGQAAAAPPPG